MDCSVFVPEPDLYDLHYEDNAKDCEPWHFIIIAASIKYIEDSYGIHDGSALTKVKLSDSSLLSLPSL